MLKTCWNKHTVIPHLTQRRWRWAGRLETGRTKLISEKAINWFTDCITFQIIKNLISLEPRRCRCKRFLTRKIASQLRVSNGVFSDNFWMRWVWTVRATPIDSRWSLHTVYAFFKMEFIKYFNQKLLVNGENTTLQHASTHTSFGSTWDFLANSTITREHANHSYEHIHHIVKLGLQHNHHHNHQHIDIQTRSTQNFNTNCAWHLLYYHRKFRQSSSSKNTSHQITYQ
jgi:hypothetical protein